MKNKIKLSFMLFLLSFTLVSYDRFTVEREDYDKYTNTTSIKTKDNWVKSDQGKYISFDFILTSTQEGESDHFLILRVDNERYFHGQSFYPGEYLILTLNGAEKIRLKLSYISSFGKNIRLKNASETHTVYLKETIFNQIICAQSIYFELQGSRINKYFPEITGFFKDENLKNLKELSKIK